MDQQIPQQQFVEQQAPPTQRRRTVRRTTKARGRKQNLTQQYNSQATPVNTAATLVRKTRVARRAKRIVHASIGTAPFNTTTGAQLNPALIGALGGFMEYRAALLGYGITPTQLSNWCTSKF